MCADVLSKHLCAHTHIHTHAHTHTHTHTRTHAHTYMPAVIQVLYSSLTLYKGYSNIYFIINVTLTEM